MMKNTNGLILTTGVTGSGKSRTLSLLRVTKKNAAFRDWDANLKENEQRPRGKYFKSRRAKFLRKLNTVTLEDPIEYDMRSTFNNDGFTITKSFTTD